VPLKRIGLGKIREFLETCITPEEAKDWIDKLTTEKVQTYIRQLIQRTSCTLDDVENFFLGSLDRESRTPAAESKWIGYAEFVFYPIAVPQRKQVQDIVAKYGPDFIAIPSPPPS